MASDINCLQMILNVVIYIIDVDVAHARCASRPRSRWNANLDNYHKYVKPATSVLDDAHVAGMPWYLVLSGTGDQIIPCTRLE